MGSKRESDEESFHSADEDVDEEEDTFLTLAKDTVASEGVGMDAKPDSPLPAPSVDSRKQEKRPKALWTEEGEEAWEREEETPKDPAVPSLDSAPGWDVEDWGDFEEEPMVTPGTGLPPANPSWARLPEETGDPQPAPKKKEKDLASPLERLAGEDGGSGSNFWGGFNTLLSSVGEGLTNVMESVETTLGAPSPEELVRMSAREREELKKKADEVKEPWPPEDKDDCDSAEEGMSEGGSEAGGGPSDECSSGYQSDSARSKDTLPRTSPLSGLFSGVTKTFESTSKSLVAGSLDVLESLGKKTFDVLTETDKETQRKRFLLSQEKPNLSRVLKEQKDKAEAHARLQEEEDAARRANYALLFEQYQGMVNLEALEMLSENCKKQVELIMKNSEENLADALGEVEVVFLELQDVESFSEEEDHDFPALLREEVGGVGVSLSPEKLLALQRRRRVWVDECSRDQELGAQKEEEEIYRESMECLAELTAASVELFHKLGQLILLAETLPNHNALVR